MPINFKICEQCKGNAFVAGKILSCSFSKFILTRRRILDGRAFCFNFYARFVIKTERYNTFKNCELNIRNKDALAEEILSSCFLADGKENVWASRSVSIPKEKEHIIFQSCEPIQTCSFYPEQLVYHLNSKEE